MKITGLYTPRIVTVTKSDSILIAASLMSEHDIGALPVLENGRLVGMVSERDLVHAMARGYSPQGPIAECMSTGAAWIHPGADSSEAAHKMLVLGIRHLPVVQFGKVVGMISARDLLAVAAWPVETVR